jgi:hypothetical protein
MGMDNLCHYMGRLRWNALMIMMEKKRGRDISNESCKLKKT